jgi:alkylmercury lyase
MIRNENAITTGNELWEAASRSFPQVSPEEQRFGIVLLRELARGEPVAIPQLARVLNKPVENAEALTKDSALSPFVYAGEGGRIQGFFGLSVTPTHHQIRIHGRKLWAWCALDTLAYAELLGDTAAIESRDPETGQMIRVTVSPIRIETVEPTGVVASIRRPESWDASSSDRIMASACHFHFFFDSRAAGERWVAKHPETFLLSVDEGYAFIKLINRHMFGTELAQRRPHAA